VLGIASDPRSEKEGKSARCLSLSRSKSRIIGRDRRCQIAGEVSLLCASDGCPTRPMPNRWHGSDFFVGPADEWHLDFGNDFRHLAFHLGAWLSEIREFLVESFPCPGLVTIGAIGDAVGGDGVQQ
jgi:hypothetical protein